MNTSIFSKLLAIITGKTPATKTIETQDEICSPQAVRETYIGDHLENLAAHLHVEISPIGTSEFVENLPVWASLEANNDNPKLYRDLFWETEPMGEYLYYLAGDFLKNEKGLLRFASTTTSVIVEVNFEDDVLNVAQIDGSIEQEEADNRQDMLSEITKLSIEQLVSKFPRSSHQFDDRVAFISLNSLLDNDSTGLARIIVNKPMNGTQGFVWLVYEELRQAKLPYEFPRYALVKICSNDQGLIISTLIEKYLYLVKKYSNMPYVFLSGTTRG